MTSQFQTDKSVKALEITRRIYPLVKRYYQSTWQFKQEKSRPVCWLHATSLAELLRAMDIVPIIPENFCAACASKQITPVLCQIAEDRGYAHEICSYFRTTYGFMLKGKELSQLPFPGGGMPDPDFLIIPRNACLTYCKWWRVMERHYRVPTFVMDWLHIPPRAKSGFQSEYFAQYNFSELKACISFLEQQTGKNLDEDRLREIIRLSAEAIGYFKEAQRYRQAIPCPVAGEDILSNMAALVLMAGTPECVEYYKSLAQEVKERVNNKTGVLPEERHRLLFDNLPPWYSLGFFNYFAKFKAISVFETYLYNFYAARDEFNPSLPPLDNLARKLTGAILLRMPLQDRVALTLKTARDYNVDGAILCVNRCCKLYSAASWVLKDKLLKELGIPSLIIEFDQADPREYADAAIKNRIDAFMEMLDKRQVEKAIH